jgi:hypothetical protein
MPAAAFGGGNSVPQDLGCFMARRQQPPWWWRSEVLGQVAMALLVMVAATYFTRLLMTRIFNLSFGRAGKAGIFS